MILDLPEATIVNRRISKEKIYENVKLPPRLKNLIKSDIEAIFWRHKLAESTIGVKAGENTEEIQVFEIILRKNALDEKVLLAIAKSIPYKILFLLTFNEEVQAWICISNTFYNTEWLLPNDLSLKLKGLNLDDIYANLIRQISDDRLTRKYDIVKAVNIDKQRVKLERTIRVLENKIKREKQFNRKVELNSKLKEIRKELERLTDE